MTAQIEHLDALLTAHQIAYSLGVSLRTIQRAGLVPAEHRGKTPLFSLASVLKWHGGACAAKAIAQAARQAERDGEDIDGARLRLTVARADAQEIENARALAELAPVALLEAAIASLVSQIGTHLEGIPAVIKREWPEVPGHILDGIERGIAQLRDTIAETEIDLPDEPPSPSERLNGETT